MSFKVGTDLSSVTMQHFSLRKNSAPKGDEPVVRVLTDGEIEERQKQQELAKINAGKRKSSDMDEFFLKFAEHRGSGVSRSPIKMAMIMDDSKDKHVITAHSDASTVEQKRIRERYNMDDAALTDLNIESKGDQPLSDAEIEMLKMSYDVRNMSEKEGLELLANLTGYEALSFQALARSSAVSNDPNEEIDYLAAHAGRAADLEALARQIERGETLPLDGQLPDAHRVREAAQAHREIAFALDKLAGTGRKR